MQQLKASCEVPPLPHPQAQRGDGEDGAEPALPPRRPVHHQHPAALVHEARRAAGRAHQISAHQEQQSPSQETEVEPIPHPATPPPHHPTTLGPRLLAHSRLHRGYRCLARRRHLVVRSQQGPTPGLLGSPTVGACVWMCGDFDPLVLLELTVPGVLHAAYGAPVASWPSSPWSRSWNTWTACGST